MSTTFTHEDIVRKVRGDLVPYGMTIDRFVELGAADALDSAELRDLWLIWGSELCGDTSGG